MKSLKLHMKLVHDDNQPEATCNECGKIYKNIRAMKAHYNMIHKKIEKNFKCEMTQCGAAFKTKQKLARHHLVHVTVREYKCVHCTKTFKDQLALNIHVSNCHKDI